jgi:AcrR family transcriptional regulator
MTEPRSRRPRAERVEGSIRRGLLLDAAEAILSEQDPLLVSFDEIARAAGVSRALVHKYVGDRRGLVDAVQQRVIERLDRWVGHGLGRADDLDSACRAITYGCWSFVEAESRGWSVLMATGGLDHPGAHTLRTRWVTELDRLHAADEGTEATDTDDAGSALAVHGLLAGVGSWVRRGVDPDDVHRAFRAAVAPTSG